MKSEKIKVCFFTQLPPPLHGQSFMSLQTRDFLKQNPRIELIEIPLTLSKNSSEIGRWKWGKIIDLFKIRRRFRRALKKHQPDLIYYVPAPPKWLAIFRDLFLLFPSRSFRKKTIFHIHAPSLGDAIQQKAHFSPLRSFYRDAITWYIAPSLKTDAEQLHPHFSLCIPNGIPDLFPKQDPVTVRMDRKKNAAHHSQPFTFLFLGMLTPEKGVFLAQEAVFHLAKKFPQQQFALNLAGHFNSPKTKTTLLDHPANPSNLSIRHLGFVHGETKANALLDADALLLPTKYPYEGAPLVILEALSSACPVVAHPWRGIPNQFPDSHPFHKHSFSPDSFIQLFPALEKFTDFATLRNHFLQNFSDKAYKTALYQAIEISWQMSKD